MRPRLVKLLTSPNKLWPKLNPLLTEKPHLISGVAFLFHVSGFRFQVKNWQTRLLAYLPSLVTPLP